MKEGGMCRDRGSGKATGGISSSRAESGLGKGGEKQKKENAITNEALYLKLTR